MGWVNQCGVVFKKVNKHTTLKPLVLGPKKIPLGQKFILATLGRSVVSKNVRASWRVRYSSTRPITIWRQIFRLPSYQCKYGIFLLFRHNILYELYHEPRLVFLFSYIERVVDRLPLMNYGLKLSLEAWNLKFKKKIIQLFKIQWVAAKFRQLKFFM